MTYNRHSGILLHPTSLPGRFGSGDLGPAAYHFIDWLVAESGSTRIKADTEVSLAIGITQEAASFPSRVHGSINSCAR